MEHEVEQLEIKHTGGIGWFFFALIPGALAGAALMWLAFYTGVIDWRKTERIEARMDDRVGVHGELKTPVDLVVRDSQSSCLRITRAYLDGSKLTTYLTNNCHTDLDYWEVHWNAAAPDHTVIHSGYTNHMDDGAVGIGEGLTMEVTFDISRQDDDRTDKIVVWSVEHS
jgi:hypothetical protein